MLGHTINNYLIVRKLGDGGMGAVYYAKHNRIDREVAIKVLHANLFSNANIRNRFKNEANALIKLNHPNIVKIYDYLEQDNMACLVMEYIHGSTLDEYIAKITGPLPEQKAIPIIGAVLDAVQFAHDSNIYHRDIKPGNIMIPATGTTAKIMDFGIAKLTDAADMKTTHANAQLGTPFYMSPEQVKGMPFTRQSDIYSLGVTLFEMVTGKCPYKAITNLFELQNKIVNEPLPPTSAFYPAVTMHIQNVIKKATEKNPSNRFVTCAEFKNYLHADEATLPAITPSANGTAKAALPVNREALQRTEDNDNYPATDYSTSVFPVEEPARLKRKRTMVWLVIIGVMATGIFFAVNASKSKGSGPDVTVNTNNAATGDSAAHTDTPKTAIHLPPVVNMPPAVDEATAAKAKQEEQDRINELARKAKDKEKEKEKEKVKIEDLDEPDPKPVKTGFRILSQGQLYSDLRGNLNCHGEEYSSLSQVQITTAIPGAGAQQSMGIGETLYVNFTFKGKGNNSCKYQALYKKQENGFGFGGLVSR